MAGMTDTAFRRLVKRHGGCGLVVTEMVSSEGLVRGIDRTLEYAEYTEEERPVSIQIFGGDPDKMAEAARIVEGMGADIVDVNMGCPVPKIAKHNAGCSLMREPAHAATVIAAMAKAVSDSGDGEDARRLERRGAQRAGNWRGRWKTQAPRRSRCTAARRPRATAAPRTGISWPRSPGRCRSRCSAAATASSRNRLSTKLASGVEGVLVGRGVLRNPWILAQAADLAAGRPARAVTLEDRGCFLIEYIELLKGERIRDQGAVSAISHERWIVNKIRALATYFTKGHEHGSHVRTAINSAPSLASLYEIIAEKFSVQEPAEVVSD